MLTNRSSLVAMTLISIAVGCSLSAHAQDSAPSSHFVFDDNFAGDIIINEVRVPKSGAAMYTYYETLGWRGKGAGYAGIQVHPKAHLYIFSIWDNKAHTAPIKAVHQGPGTEVVGFGGEGTGLKSWNFDLGWSTDVWYTLVARTWPVDDHTHYGCWVRSGETKKWTHLVTMDVAAEASFQGGTDAFIEDWSNTGKEPRTTHMRGGWKRNSDGNWIPFGTGRYSVNAWDLKPGKRSYNFRTNWNGGVQEDPTGKYFFMTSGGARTVPSVANPSTHQIERPETAPGYEKIRIAEVTVTPAAGNTLSVSWDLDETTAPQFSYQIKVFDNQAGRGTPLVTVSNRIPQATEATIDVSSLDLAGSQHYVQLQCVDILDRHSDAKMVAVPGPTR
jgi:hypothetical protein